LHTGTQPELGDDLLIGIQQGNTASSNYAIFFDDESNLVSGTRFQVKYNPSALPSKVDASIKVSAITFGDTVRFDVSVDTAAATLVAIPPATGRVDVMSLNSRCTVMLTEGRGSCDLPRLQGGEQKIQADFFGDAVYKPSRGITSVMVRRAQQTISFPKPPDVASGTKAVLVFATAPASGYVTFTSLTPSVCTTTPIEVLGLVPENRVTLLRDGVCTLVAKQSGTNNYEPAPDVTQSFKVGMAVKADQVITFAQPSSQLIAANATSANLLLGASASTTTPPVTILTVTLTSLTPAVCQFNSVGNTAAGVASNLLVMTAAGTCTIRASQPGDANTNAAADVTRSFLVQKEVPIGITDPCSTNNPDYARLDCDADGIPNGEEVASGLNPNVKDNNLFANTPEGYGLFVNQLYRDILERAADAGGRAFWTNELVSGRYNRVTLTEAFLFSNEYVNTLSPVLRMHFIAGEALPSAQTVGAQLQTLRGSGGGNALLAIARDIVSSAAYQTRFASLTGDALIEALYQNALGRAPSAAELNMARGQLSTDTSATAAAGLISYLAQQGSFTQALRNPVNAYMLYFGLLRRAPEPAGYSYWLTELNRSNDLQRLIASFINSTEYQLRFLPN
jgi:hypothetical protein